MRSSSEFEGEVENVTSCKQLLTQIEIIVKTVNVNNTGASLKMFINVFWQDFWNFLTFSFSGPNFK